MNVVSMLGIDDSGRVDAPSGQQGTRSSELDIAPPRDDISLHVVELPEQRRTPRELLLGRVPATQFGEAPDRREHEAHLGAAAEKLTTHALSPERRFHRQRESALASLPVGFELDQAAGLVRQPMLQRQPTGL